MRLDEAISHARHVSTRTDLCRKCRKQYEQLAGWLEELAKYRAENRRKLFTVFRCRKCGHRLYVKEDDFPRKLEKIAGMSCPDCGEQDEGLWCLLGRAGTFRGRVQCEWEEETDGA